MNNAGYIKHYIKMNATTL